MLNSWGGGKKDGAAFTWQDVFPDPEGTQEADDESAKAFKANFQMLVNARTAQAMAAGKIRNR